MGVQHLVQFSNRETYVGAAAHFHLQQKKLLVSQILVNHICMPCPSPVSHRLKNVGTRRNPVHSVTEARLPGSNDKLRSPVASEDSEEVWTLGKHPDAGVGTFVFHCLEGFKRYTLGHGTTHLAM